MLPIMTIVQAVLALWRGPLTKILDAHIGDQALRAKLSAEIEAALAEQLGQGLAAQGGAVVSEIRSEHWLARSWRPLLMLLFMALLVLYGVLLPAVDLIAARPIPFSPRWRDLPPEFWNLLTVGLGGYVGGRSLEKIADAAIGKVRETGRKGGLFSRR
jgi:hypothetical protein